jgi:two-component system LytT family response regulator
MNAKKIHAFIVEDEPKAIVILEKLLDKYCTEVQIIGTATALPEAKRKIIEANRIDLLFMDLNLGSDNGFTLLDDLKREKIPIIFTTGYEQYALKAFGYKAIHYLLKPIDPKELIEAVDRYKEDRLIENTLSLKTQDSKEYATRLALPISTGYELISIDEIIRCEGKGAYTSVITKSDSDKLVSKSLGYFEEMLNPEVFTRIHKKHIINLKELVQYTKDKAPGVRMSNGDEINVSWRNRSQFFELLKKTTAL